MGTRGDIIVERTDNKWARIYLHWDSYLEHAGKILHEHYNSQSRAEAVAAPGDISSLAEKCGKPKGHSFDSRVEGYCVYYGRDRGETGVDAKVFDTLDNAWPKDSGTEYTYVWKRDGGWFVGDPDKGPQSLVPLADALAGKNPPLPNIKAFGQNIVIGTRTGKPAKAREKPVHKSGAVVVTKLL